MESQLDSTNIDASFASIIAGLSFLGIIEGKRFPTG
jgi:hypothetical protein